MTGLAPGPVRFEHLGADVVGIGRDRPRLSWDLPLGLRQSVSELRIGDRVFAGDDSRVLVAWPDAPLASRERRTVQVRVRDAASPWSPWSEPSVVEAALLEPHDWVARWVAPAGAGRDDPLPLFRSPRFTVRAGLERARIHATAHGVYELDIDEVRVGDRLLAPGWQSYRHRLEFQTYDVTGQLPAGEHVLGAMLGDGWWRGRLGFPLIVRPDVYGSGLALLAQLELEYADGSREVVSTGADWSWAEGPIISSDLYDGEHHDARREPRDWSPVALPIVDPVPLVAAPDPPVRVTEVLEPVATLRSPSGALLLDFGQNLVGRPRIRVQGRAGDEVVLRHAEVLEHGELGTRPLRTAKATDRYILGADGEQEWAPRFTYHGFRFVEVAQWPGSPRPGDIVAEVVHSDLERTGWFETDDALLNRLHENVLWSTRGNFVDIPTDCPQRDERLGWTGDIAVFAPTAAFLFEVGGFLESWLADLRLEQRPDGTVPFFVPELELPAELAHLPGLALAPTAVWGDAAVTVPMALFDRSGDVGLLARQYDSMRAWVDRVLELAGRSGVWDEGFQFGDWLDPSAPPEHPSQAMTETALVATASLARSARLLARAASLLGRTDDERRYQSEADRVGTAFRERFWRGDRATSDTQTAYAIAIEWDLLNGADLAAAGDRLAELVRANGHRIGTGFVGTSLILDALTTAGYRDDAYRLLQQTEAPSWLYTVRMGGTTIWERWDSLLPDGSVNPGEMTSFNHYALGAVADWMHRTIGGLAPAAPGYREVRIAPRPGGGVTRARTAHRSPYGLIEVAWWLEGERLHVDASLPAGITGILDLGDGEDRVTGVVSRSTSWPLEGTESAIMAYSDSAARTGGQDD
ncbi:alpha-L-rhamnosidase [Antiquaquibacter soli]|uniref:alpha-L-rhamnosidase n=1 Tax=Antiquaquibacter soli TaxID=3064523 RepID=A0ABT9BNZ7_9MICO|nr:alpha-L-rhamnosidase [Protaetiibacter sp. WY-16]MDO7882754.1 family 78 glycoside hydrolase catalytic domain [Protaetiibacter sp. WY-16]